MITDIEFTGQQEGERILLAIRPHHISIASEIIKVSLGALLILFVAFLVSNLNITANGLVSGLMILSALVFFIVGLWIIVINHQKQVTYITDRRIIRFQATTPFTITNRSLSWHDVVKIKTYSSNLIHQNLKVGTVVIHSHSTMTNTVELNNPSSLSDDDIDIHYVYYYHDIGNYLDKILYLYRQTPSDLNTLKPFIYKPKGKRD